MTDVTIIAIIARLAELSETEQSAFWSAMASHSPVMPWAVIHVAAGAVSRILHTGSKADHQSAVKSALFLDEDQEINTTAALLGSIEKITALAVKVATTRAERRRDPNIRRVIEACEDNRRACRISQKEWDFIEGLVLDSGVTGAANEGLDENARQILAAAAEEWKGDFQEASVARLLALVLADLSSANKKRKAEKAEKAESEPEESSGLLLLTPPPSPGAGEAGAGEAAPVKPAVSLKRARRDLTDDFTACAAAAAAVASVV